MQLDLIKKEFQNASEPKYRDFSLKLTNNSQLPMIGVRLPYLRNMAKIIKEDGSSRDFLEACDFSSIEMCLLYSYVLGGYKSDADNLLFFFDKAAAHVDNWCTCDILCQSFRQCEQYREKVWRHLTEFIGSGKTYYMRIAVVTMMSHFLTDEYIDAVLDVISEYLNDDYYYKMAVAWATATAMAKYRDKTLRFLENCSLDDWTFNKSIQKMIESRRISAEDKEKLRKMKKPTCRNRSNT